MSAQELPANIAPGTSPESTSRPAPSDARPQRPADTHLRLRGLTDDGTRLLLVDGAGLEFTVDIDARLRAALHGDPSRTDPSSQSTPTRSGANSRTSEKTMESILLRPRDIQARIRAGETPEAVAEAAQTTLEKVMPYAAPVLAEREHVAQRALRASIRRPAADRPSEQPSPAGTNRTLGDSVSSRLRGMNVDPDSVVWDAWRREDGRWTLTASFSAGGQEGVGRLTYDQRGNFVLLDNDEARWLVGDHLETSVPSAPETEREPEPAGRLLTAVPSEQLALTPDELGADALDMVRDPVPGPATDLGVEQPIEAFLDVDVTPATDEQTTEELEVVAADPATDAATGPAADEPPARPPARKRRASVPSWDEIMFGGPSDGDRA
ncbi:septation protein SepH [Nocardioides dilutus]